MSEQNKDRKKKLRASLTKILKLVDKLPEDLQAPFYAVSLASHEEGIQQLELVLKLAELEESINE